MSTYGVPTPIRQWLQQVLRSLPFNLQLDFWHRDVLQFGTSAPDAETPLTLHIKHPGVLRALFQSGDPLALVDAYLRDFIDIEGNLTPVLPLIQAHCHAHVDRWQAFRAWLSAWQLPPLPATDALPSPWKRLRLRSRDRDRLAVQHHYDMGNDFYQLWLDPHMVYSCAYFEHPQMTLQAAQEAKLDRICRKLKLSPGETLLDIGCGWGALLRWAAHHYGVKAHGITLSKAQLTLAQQSIAEAGLGEQVTVALQDYRDLPATPTYDKVVSVGMVEHVGAANYPAYFSQAVAVLKPGGLFLNHGITSSDRWHGTSIGEQFINRYIFPDGQLTRLSTHLRAAEDAGLEIVDVDAWRLHYAKTLRCWVENFDAVFDAVVEKIGKQRANVWRLYLMGSALGFENNHIGIYQTLFRRKQDAAWNLPLTRQEWLC